VTKVEQAMALMRRLRELHAEVCDVQQRLTNVKREMGHPDDVQIERAFEMKRDIRRGCTQGP
jgi:hypothetical protein